MAPARITSAEMTWMGRRKMIIRYLVAATLATAAMVTEASAHGGVSLEGGQCIMKIGPYTMNFTGYQPQKSRETFCDDIPDVGPTIIVLDAQQDDLRDMNLEIRVLKDVGQKDDNENVEANTEYFIAAKKYRTGTLNFEHIFPQKGKFIGLVKAKSDDGAREYVSRFPFAVGETGDRDILVAVVLGGAALVGFGVWFRSAFGKKKPA
jgi:hypothetical protein